MMYSALLGMLDRADELLLTESDSAEVARLEGWRARIVRNLELNDAFFQNENKRLSDEAEGGNKRAVLEMAAFCGREGRPIPDWVALEFFGIMADADTGRIKSWDDVFGPPLPKNTKHEGVRLHRELAPLIWDALQKRREAGDGSIAQSTFDAIAEDLVSSGLVSRISGGLVNKIYYELITPRGTAEKLLCEKGPPNKDFYEL
jgi:hypothetical protein